MTADLVLPGTAPEADWLAARRTGVTASEIAIIMGLSPWSSPFGLYHRKLGNLGEQPDNAAMALGRYLEHFVAEQFAVRRAPLCPAGDGRALYSHPQRPWQMATPDRFVFEGLHHAAAAAGNGRPPLAVLECKTDASSDGWGDDGTDEIPVHYRCQVLWACDVLGVDRWYLACLFLHSRVCRVYEGQIDGPALADLAVMRAEARTFLHRVECQDPPPVDWRPATAAALKRLHPSLDEDREVLISGQLASRYRAAVRNLKAAEQKKALYDNRIRQQLGTGHYAVDAATGRNVARRDVYDLAEKTILRKASTVDRLMPVKPKDPS